jgi:hypothetical protein
VCIDPLRDHASAGTPERDSQRTLMAFLEACRLPLGSTKLAGSEYRRRGVWIREFTLAGGGATSWRPMVGFAPDTQTDCFAISPDGRRLALALKGVSRHLVMIDGIRGVGR